MSEMRSLVLVVAAVLMTLASCGGNSVDPVLAQLLADDDSTTDARWLSAGMPAPDDGCRRMRIRPFGGSLGRVFRDRNNVHLRHAEAAGIQVINSTQDAWNNACGIVKIRSCSIYYVERMSYSYPYLTRGAADLLGDICIRFHDSLASRGGGSYRPKVTSVLRTSASVGRLRRVNRNATNESAHRFATTFDLSYNKFICDDSTAPGRTFEDLKNLLGEVVASLRSEGRCVVKFERRQACFHITVCDSATNQCYEQTD